MHWKKRLDNSKYIGAYSLSPGEDRVVTIKSIAVEEVLQAGGKKDQCTVLTLAGGEKPMIINSTNSKTLAKLYGSDDDKWIGKSFTLYASTTSVAGEQMECLRIRPVVPGPKKKQTITDEKLAKALASVESGTYSLEKILAAYELTEEQLQRLPKRIEGTTE